MFRGHFSATLFFKISAPTAIFSLIAIYYQSQIYHQQPPFPHQYISKVAQHYPEYVVFRLGTISGSVLLILGWLTNHFMLQTVAKESGLNLKVYHGEIMLVMGLMGGMLLMGLTATIDTGFMNEKAHEFLTRFFFIFTFLAQIYNTAICVSLQKKTNLMSKCNLYAKFFVLALLTAQLIYGNIKEYWLGVDSDKSKFLEWTLTSTVISMFISIGMDAQKFQFVFVDTSQKETSANQALMF